MSYVLGIDVGAARTSAAVARPGADDVEPVDLGDGACGVASVLHLGADGSLDVGAAAERWADGEPDRVVRGFPGRIGDDVPMLLAGEPWAPEELTAWLVRWVVDRVAEREGAPGAGVAVTRPESWDDDRIALLAGALTEQDLDVTFLTTARAAEWHPAESRSDGAARVASAAACGAALALLAGDVEAERTDDVAARGAALARLPGTTVGDADDPPPAEVPAPRAHHSGSWSTDRSPMPGDDERESGGPRSGRRRAEGEAGSGEGSGADPAVPPAGPVDPADRPDDGSAAQAPVSGDRASEVSAERPDPDPPGGAPTHHAEASTTVDASPSDDDGLVAALGGFTGTLGATNTAGLLSGYTPPSGLALSATGSRATALVMEADEPLALPAQRNGSGRWAAVPDDEEVESEPDAAPALERGRSPAALVSIGGAAAAVAVVSTLFLWPAPRTTNSAISRPVPLVPAATAPAEPTVELTPTPTTTHRPRPAPARTRRAVPPPVVETTPAPSVSTEPTTPTGSTSPSASEPASESTSATTSTTKPKDD